MKDPRLQGLDKLAQAQRTMMLIARAGNVSRYHNELVAPQTVGHHSFGVAWFVVMLCHGEPPWYLLYAAIQHDVAEAVVGDVPAPTKRVVPGLKDALDKYEDEVMASFGIADPNLDDIEKRILKFADIFEGMLYCCTQRSTGNKNADGIFSNFRDYAAAMEPSGIAMELFHTLVELYSNVSE